MFNDLNKNSNATPADGFNVNKNFQNNPPAAPLNKNLNSIPSQNLNQTQPISSQNQNKGVEDIFAGVDENKEKIPTLTAVEPSNAAQSNIAPQPSNVGKKVILIIVVLLVIGGIGFGGYYAYSKFFQKKSTVSAPAPVTQNPPATPTEQNNAQNNTPANANPQNQPPQAPTNANVVSTDSDSDGLSNEKEKEIGTNLNNPDTDNDGLSDYAEVEVYKTNPNNPDTDGDGFKDGDEVKGKYNPNGSGKFVIKDGKIVIEDQGATVTIKIDTDKDGLTDEEEITIYKTNPNNPDTDGDGFKDGDEVKSGYNPNGEGKIK